MAWIGLLALVACATASTARPDTAFGCEYTGAHCYSIAEWYMPKRPEEVKGAYAQIEAYYGQVPRWNYGDFIDDEVWVDFPLQNEDSWVEGGITIGNDYDETTPLYFVARSYNASNYWEWLYPEGPPYNAWSGLYLDQPEQSGTWCASWSWDTKPDFCWSGYPGSSTELQNGLEVATTTSSGANNNGRNFGWAQWMSGTWHYEWNDGTTHAVGVRDHPLCIVAPAPEYTWGSIAYSVPGC